MPDAITLAAAIDLLSGALDASFTVEGPLAGGETGATAIRGDDGRRFVFKWESDPQRQQLRRAGAAIAEAFRLEAGWPVPVQQVLEQAGQLLIVQELMPGSNVTRLTNELLDTLLSLHARRLGIGDPEQRTASADGLIETLITGGNGYCLHDPLREHDDHTRRIVEQIESIGRSLDPVEVAGNDLVHADLHPGNLLAVDGRLSAVVDLDFARVGDATFDLVMLALVTPTVRTEPGVVLRLQGVVDGLSDAKRSAYIGHFVLRFLDWAIRKQRTRDIAFWAAEFDRLLPR